MIGLILRRGMSRCRLVCLKKQGSKRSHGLSPNEPYLRTRAETHFNQAHISHNGPERPDHRVGKKQRKQNGLGRACNASSFRLFLCTATTRASEQGQSDAQSNRGLSEVGQHLNGSRLPICTFGTVPDQAFDTSFQKEMAQSPHGAISTKARPQTWNGRVCLFCMHWLILGSRKGGGLVSGRDGPNGTE
ncbi:hypothetical protein MGG_18011 [Pyricularia oryzae 70-15]|uniref:Uncharacterized protein n=3 Tax=Pyricularia oryzae TaxID=318829 RepID=G5EI26_PYRO7|nr:uncharacterized protein MGG_18011 [Pyricularia oryzae 70-15]EAQ70947.1 hypothetical protein MGCH7_ch7g354 [Pyricularia oryzae 70-15]EHA46417.1 hypothetical protein MGG_18011 [Pyricularia oryzae 70-15]ELQ36322.1 hypothetical protein OOU_Y34scaffold00666g183 [Pyricularia oryzae Y34]